MFLNKRNIRKKANFGREGRDREIFTSTQAAFKRTSGPAERRGRVADTINKPDLFRFVISSSRITSTIGGVLQGMGVPLRGHAWLRLLNGFGSGAGSVELPDGPGAHLPVGCPAFLTDRISSESLHAQINSPQARLNTLESRRLSEGDALIFGFDVKIRRRY
jgi:hypothetical protein